MGRRESVKFADDKRDFSERGGRPCLETNSHVSYFCRVKCCTRRRNDAMTRGFFILDEVGQAEGVLPQLSQAYNVSIGDIVGSIRPGTRARSRREQGRRGEGVLLLLLLPLSSAIVEAASSPR